MNELRPEPGTVMTMQWRKWDGSAHWRSDCVYLGSDQRGDWLGQPSGWTSTRPGYEFVAETPNVALIPSGRTDYALTVHDDHPRDLRIYIDLAWDVRWESAELVTGIDMDLDVVRRVNDQGTYVDDRDEWAEHSARYGYPADVMTHLEALTLELEGQVRAQHPPFDDATGDAWLERLETLGLNVGPRAEQ
ncbi:DUF402 domain-containing protein [Microbacterium sp. H1-D42]|uniref:DUF402 domain-containing protein n=1 Tax=Microbacterium sp. H1-D42 TaxID=2925844 RepID=UPI001F53D8AE|nr:DUF402 domain-containing protein [Microbacterium sp. H1-D42]UNK71597.1 YgaC family protein [Microbacterium sp. H1-D42]